MDSAAPRLAGVWDSAVAKRALLILLAALFVGANWPWHLDNYDQAKQAWVAYEIAQGGDWWFQHTPRGRLATKPPLMGWMSAALYAVGLPWDWAWRLPSLVAAGALGVVVFRCGQRLWAGVGGWVALAAFGLNFLTPRLAGLVRTDMLLALGIALCGALMLHRAGAGGPWTLPERLGFGAAMTAALFTKGPVIYAFLVPGLVAWLILAPRGRKRDVWCGWLPWMVPLGLFAGWVAAGALKVPEFYEQVVLREFFSRFDQSLKPHERQQPWWFYFPHLLHKFLPWSLLLLGLAVFSQNARRAVRRRPEALWLACWALGGLLFMTLVPSKRVDRIFPVIPPLALLLVAMAGACGCGARVRAWCAAGVLAGAAVWGGTFAVMAAWGWRENARGLVEFGRRVAEESRGAVIVAGRDEGLAIYAGVRGFTGRGEAARLHRQGRDLVVPERLVGHEPFEFLKPSQAAFASGKRPSGDNYLFFRGVAP